MPQIPKEKFLFFYDQLADDIFAYCYSELKNREKAKTVLEETFCEVWRRNLIGGLHKNNYKQFLYLTADKLIMGKKDK